METKQKNVAYILEDELRYLSNVLSVFAPCRALEQETMSEAVAMRSGLAPFPVSLDKVTTESGFSFVDAPSAPGGTSIYRYMLLRKCAEINVLTGAMTLTDGRSQKPVAATTQELLALDMRPGRYYVTAQDESGVGVSLLLGPFPMHVQALAKLERVRSHCAGSSVKGAWLKYGTSRFKNEEREGDLNARLLSPEEMATLVPRGLLAASKIKAVAHI